MQVVATVVVELVVVVVEDDLVVLAGLLELLLDGKLVEGPVPAKLDDEVLVSGEATLAGDIEVT